MEESQEEELGAVSDPLATFDEPHTRTRDTSHVEKISSETELRSLYKIGYKLGQGAYGQVHM